jgi:hypothetical protein
MSCRLKVWREFDAIVVVPVVLLLKHRPRISALGATPHPEATVASPPAGFRHVGQRSEALWMPHLTGEGGQSLGFCLERRFCDFALCARTVALYFLPLPEWSPGSVRRAYVRIVLAMSLYRADSLVLSMVGS